MHVHPEGRKAQNAAYYPPLPELTLDIIRGIRDTADHDDMESGRDMHCDNGTLENPGASLPVNSVSHAQLGRDHAVAASINDTGSQFRWADGSTTPASLERRGADVDPYAREGHPKPQIRAAIADKLTYFSDNV